jgi:hypothetical protein
MDDNDYENKNQAQEQEPQTTEEADLTPGVKGIKPPEGPDMAKPDGKEERGPDKDPASPDKTGKPADDSLEARLRRILASEKTEEEKESELLNMFSACQEQAKEYLERVTFGGTSATQCALEDFLEKEGWNYRREYLKVILGTPKYLQRVS